MKLLNKVFKPKLTPIFLGLSEDEHYYCLVKRESEKFSVFWQEKPYDLVQFIQKTTLVNISDKKNLFKLIRPLPHEYIWRKTIFLPKTLNEIQLHQHIIYVIEKEQPLPIETLNIDYQQSSHTNDTLKITIYALRKSYTDSLRHIPCILDCELYCYMRAVIYLKDIQITDKYPCFSFKGKIIQFTKTKLQFCKVAPEHCINIQDIPIPKFNICSDSVKHLYLLAFGASLWNGKVLI